MQYVAMGRNRKSPYMFNHIVKAPRDTLTSDPYSENYLFAARR
jgi:hypothetical protein